MLNPIPAEEICFHPTSFCDRDGRVFWWQGALYRGIAPQYAPLCRQLFDTGVVRSLVAKGFLIETELTNLSLPDYPLVLKHRQLSFVSYASEWCPEMLRDAAQFTLDMMCDLATYNLPNGLTLDVGTWDVLFEGYAPRYVDFCSVTTADTYDYHSWCGVLDDFRSYFINPLRLMSQGHGHMARWLLGDYEHRIIHAELADLLGQRIYGNRANQSLGPFRHRLGERYCFWRSRRDPCRLDLVKQMQKELSQIPSLPSAPNIKDSHSSEPNFSETISEILSKLRPATLLDIGCGDGHYSRMAAKLGAQVVAIDHDDRQVARCYQQAKAKQLSVLPLVIDIRYPTPAQGLGNQVIMPALKRFSCELVLALDLLHLLVFEQHLTLPQAVGSLSAFATRWLLVEFSQAKFTHYTAQALIEQLSLSFPNIRIVSAENSDRQLLLCER